MSNGDSGGSTTMAISFKGAHFPQDIILMGVRCGLGQMRQDTYGKPYLHTFLAFLND
jgi:hypothetical protein